MPRKHLPPGRKPRRSKAPSEEIRGAENFFADTEDWRILGTEEDPAVQEALAMAHRSAAGK